MILKGDCFDLIKDIDSKSVDLILVDPPYFISRNSNFKNYSDDTSKELITKYIHFHPTTQNKIMQCSIKDTLQSKKIKIRYE